MGLKPELKDMLSIHEGMKLEVTSGRLNKLVRDVIFERGEFTFDASEKGPGYVDKLYQDGRRITGRLTQDGHFVELEP